MYLLEDLPRVGHLRGLAEAHGFWLRRDHSVDDGYWLVDRAAAGDTHDSGAAGAAIPLAEVARRLGAEAALRPGGLSQALGGGVALRGPSRGLTRLPMHPLDRPSGGP